MQVEGVSFPALAGLFVTHFDDMKGQTVIFWRGIDDLKPGLIEHTSLPSGLHLLKEDFITFTHPSSSTLEEDDDDYEGGTREVEEGGGRGGRGGRISACALFRSKVVSGGRGRRMASLGVVLPANQPSHTLNNLQTPLTKLYDHLESLSGWLSPDPKAREQMESVLDGVWGSWKVGAGASGRTAGSGSGHRGGGAAGPSSHPIAYLPALVDILGPSIVGLYKASLSGKRILLYSPPPFLPLTSLAYCLHAIGQPPSNVAVDSAGSRFLGNVGLVDLNALKEMRGGWVGTTSDAIYKTQTKVYDLFIDLSSCDISSLRAGRAHTPEEELEEDNSGSSTATYTPVITSTISSAPSSSSSSSSSNSTIATTKFTYAFTDLPFYKSLLILSTTPLDKTFASRTLSAPNTNGPVDSESPSTKKRIPNPTGQWWLIALDLVEGVWKVCIGVCGYALGRGGGGDISLPPGEGVYQDESERLLSDTESLTDTVEGELKDEVEDEEVRRGKLLLSQFLHNTYHLYLRLEEVVAERKGVQGGGGLEDKEVRRLVGWLGRGKEEERFWKDLAVVWGLVA